MENGGKCECSDNSYVGFFRAPSYDENHAVIFVLITVICSLLQCEMDKYGQVIPKASVDRGRNCKLFFTAC